MATVTSNLTRIADLEGAPATVAIGGGAGAAANTDIYLQATQSLARRVSAATLGGFWLDDAVNNDLSAVGTHVGLWVWCTHYRQLTAMEVWLGTTTANYDRHVFAFATEYPNLGGWVRTWVHVNRTPDTTVGTGATESQVRYFGAVVSLPTVGGNAANVALDAVDSTSTGLTLTGTVGLFSDFTTADENSTNQYGVIRRVSGVFYCYARLTLGTATSLSFSDSNFTVVFPQQGLVADTFMGVTADLQNASTTITFTNGTFSSPGTTKKGDFIVTGTAGVLAANACVFNGLRVLTLTSKVTFSGCSVIASGLVTQAGATFTDCAFASPSGAVGVLASDPSKFTTCRFSSAGTGHALQLTTPGTYNFSGNQFTGYAATNGSTGNEAIYNNSGGAVTLNIIGGGTAPSVRDGAGATTTLVINPVTTSLNVRDATSSAAVQSARVLLTAADGTGPLPFEATVTISRSGTTATVAHTGHGLSTGDKILIKGANEIAYNGVFAVTVVNTNSYTYTVAGSPATPATGTIKATGVVLEGLTDAAGAISSTKSWGSSQPITGRVRRATTGTLYKTGTVSGTVSNTSGFSATVLLIRDE